MYLPGSSLVEVQLPFETASLQWVGRKENSRLDSFTRIVSG
jgi:hypothetical protein